MNKIDTIKEQIHSLINEYYEEVFQAEKPFIPGKTHINYGGRFFDEKELINLVDASLDFWLTAGPWANRFEKRFAQWLGVDHCSLVNSGSSANLLAFMALTSPELGEKRIKRGDEIITVAAGFPTTVSPIIQYGAIPVFIDVEIPSYNIDVRQLENAVSGKTKAVMIAHTLGNPFDLEAVKSFCEKYGLWLIEDNCDALGSLYFIDGVWKKTGTIGHIGTSSFYPPHHMTMGEGGAVYTNDPALHRLVNSFRDWGRDCWCMGGVDNTCKYRFSKRFGELPEGYDHKYVYSHFGYNLKATDMQAAIGCAQLEKIDGITEARRSNWSILYEALEEVPDLILPVPQTNSLPGWFGFIISVDQKASFTRNELTSFLENKKIQTRNLFAGNLIKHPAFDEMRNTGEGYRVVGNLQNTDFIMNNSFWIGVYPGMKPEMLSYMTDCIKEFVYQHKK
jgi:CDP-6-deoxy-D-xylo-4-hexulose-3-dehydrase